MAAKKTFNNVDIKRAVGVMSSLFALLCLLSFATHLWGLSFASLFLLGLPGYWALLPFLVVFGLLVTFFGKIPSCLGGKRLLPSFILLLVGLCIILTDVVYSGKESFLDFSLFSSGSEKINGFSYFLKGEQHVEMPFAFSIGGGALGYLLAGLFSFGKGQIVPLLIGSLFLLIALFVLLFPLIKKGILKLTASFHLQHSRKKADKERNKFLNKTRENSLIEGDIEYENLEGVDINDPLPDWRERISISPEDDSALPTESLEHLSRRELYGKTRMNPSIPVESTSSLEKPVFVSPASMATSGLKEAVFMSEEVLVNESKETLSPAKFPANPYLEITPKPLPVKDVETITVPKEEKEIVNPLPVSPIDTNSQVEQTKEVVEDLDLGNMLFEEEASGSDSLAMSEKAPVPPVKEAKEMGIPVKEEKADERAPIFDEKNISYEQTHLPLPENVALPIKSAKPDPLALPVASPRPPYAFPNEKLLTIYPPSDVKQKNEDEAKARMDTINETFNDLSVPATAVSYTIGPSVTRYDIKTDRDASVQGIVRYIRDISIRLGGIGARFEELVPGKSTSGLEIPNLSTETVPFKEVFDAMPEVSEKTNMFVPFGKTISGKCLSSDLSEFPHMLVAGTTGSGKSIFIHGLILALIMRNRPEDLKLVLVDPKHVEMSKYRNLPHLLCPIIKEPSQARVCLDKLIEEMERRYSVFENVGVSNIRQFNEEYVPEANVDKMPFIVMVIDEFADLALTCKGIEAPVIRLTSKARAAGIHLIIATQRPSVDIITGPVKSNLGVRVALRTASDIDSRTILNSGGAEELVGHGDMLVDCTLISRMGFTRMQGCYVSNKEIDAVANFIRSQAVTHYDPRFLDLADKEAERKAAEANAPKISISDMRAASDDELYSSLKEAVAMRSYASVSWIQRTFGVGFPRAGKMFARLQAEGLVAREGDTASSSKGCRVLIHDDSVSSNPGSTDQSEEVYR